MPIVEAEHLAAAGEWNAAHKVLMDDILPEVVLAGNETCNYCILSDRNCHTYMHTTHAIPHTISPK
jgi:hypothetical protein